MPTPYIKKLSKEGKGSVPSLEKKWDRAKDAAAKQGHSKDYGYVTNIFKSMSHASLKLQAKSRLQATEYIPDTKKLAECHIERWYDRSIRSWTVVLKDKDDNQVGDSIVVGTQGEAKKITKDNPAFNVRDFDAENALRYRKKS